MRTRTTEARRHRHYGRNFMGRKGWTAQCPELLCKSTVLRANTCQRRSGTPHGTVSLQMMHFCPLLIGVRLGTATIAAAWHGAIHASKCGRGKSVKGDRDPRSAPRTKRIIFTPAAADSITKEGKARRGALMIYRSVNFLSRHTRTDGRTDGRRSKFLEGANSRAQQKLPRRSRSNLISRIIHEARRRIFFALTLEGNCT